MNKAVEIDKLDSRSEVVGRNGKFAIGRLSVLPGKDDAASKGLVKIACTSKTLKRDLNAGLILGVEDMDRLASEWLKARGIAPPHLGQLPCGRSITQAAAEIAGLAEDIQKATE